MTSQFFRGRFVTATQPTIDPLSSATKQPARSKALDDRTFFVPGSSTKPDVQSCRFFGNAPSSSGSTFLTMDCGNVLLSSILLSFGCWWLGPCSLADRLLSWARLL